MLVDPTRSLTGQLRPTTPALRPPDATGAVDPSDSVALGGGGTTPLEKAAARGKLEPELAAQLVGSLSAARSHILESASPDGMYRTPYTSGPYPALLTLIGTNYAGARDPNIYREDRTIMGQVLDQQAATGGIASHAGEPPTLGMTRLLVTGIRELKKNQAEELAKDPGFSKRLEEAQKKAEAFLANQPKRDGFAIEAFARLLDEVTTTEGRSVSGGLMDPFASLKTDTLLHSRVGKLVAENMAVGVTGMLPALAILSERAADQHDHFRLMKWLRGPERQEQMLERFEEDVKKVQDANGGWMVVAMLTGLNLMALKERGYRPEDPEMKKGIDFIRSLRHPDGPNGEIRQWWCQGDVWDTAVGAERLLSSGIKASDPQLKKSIAQLLSAQAPDGRWAFATGAEHATENDTATMPLGFLARAHNTADPDQKDAIRKAVLKSFDTMMARQHRDGGWNAYQPTIVSWGSRVPGSFEAAGLDASTVDVTGRVLASLAKVKASGLLDAERRRQLDQSVGRAVDYFQKAQTPNGSWWSRWIAGYLSAPTFVLPALNVLGRDMREPWLQDVRQFVSSHQNPDGGWGETTRADADPNLAGKGPSTPSQTAFGVISLIASSPTDDITGDPALKKAVQYLLSQQKNGAFDSQKELFTIIPSALYYDSPFNTHCVATQALELYQKASELGAAGGVRALQGS